MLQLGQSWSNRQRETISSLPNGENLLKNRIQQRSHLNAFQYKNYNNKDMSSRKIQFFELEKNNNKKQSLLREIISLAEQVQGGTKVMLHYFCSTL